MGCGCSKKPKVRKKPVKRTNRSVAPKKSDTNIDTNKK